MHVQWCMYDMHLLQVSGQDEEWIQLAQSEERAWQASYFSLPQNSESFAVSHAVTRRYSHLYVHYYESDIY